MIPIGVPMSVPKADMNRLPAMGLSRPPEFPGGGVIFRTRSGPSALNPATNSV